MSNIVPAFSTVRVTLTAAQLLATWSKGAYKTTQVNAFVNAPPQNSQLLDVPAGSLQQQSSAFTLGAVVDIDAYGGLPVFYEQGTAAVVRENRLQVGIQPAAIAVNATLNPLPSASLLNGRITSTSAAATDITLPTGTLLLAATTWAPGEYMDWVVENNGPSLLRLLPGTDHTVFSGATPGTTAVDVPTLTSVIVRTTLVSVAAAVGTFVTEAIARPIS